MQNFTQRMYLHFCLHEITLLFSLGHNSNYMLVPPVVILKNHEFCSYNIFVFHVILTSNADYFPVQP